MKRIEIAVATTIIGIALAVAGCSSMITAQVVAPTGDVQQVELDAPSDNFTKTVVPVSANDLSMIIYENVLVSQPVVTYLPEMTVRVISEPPEARIIRPDSTAYVTDWAIEITNQSESIRYATPEINLFMPGGPSQLVLARSDYQVDGEYVNEFPIEFAPGQKRVILMSYAIAPKGTVPGKIILYPSIVKWW